MSRAEKPDDTDWTQIDLLYGTLEVMQPSPVVTLNRAVAVSKVRGAPKVALQMIEPLGERLSNYFHFSSACAARFLMQLGRNHEGPHRVRSCDRALPIPRRKPPISGCISIGSCATASRTA